MKKSVYYCIRSLVQQYMKGGGGLFEENQYDSNIPIYLQIMEKIKRRIVSGEWKAGERIPAVRSWR